MKFSPQTQGGTTYATYATVKDYVVQQIQKKKDNTDVVKALEDMKPVDIQATKPIRGISRKKDDTDRKFDQDGLDMDYQELLRRYLDRLQAYEDGMLQAYALIFGTYSTRIMQHRIEEHPDFESTDAAKRIKNNPIALLKAIQALSHKPIRAQYPMLTMTEAFGNLINIKQLDDEPLLEYVKRFKQVRDVAKEYLGTEIFDYFITNTEEYREQTDPQKQAELKAAAFEQWLALLLIKNSDQSKYGTLTKKLSSDYSLGSDNYPRTIALATDAMSNHPLDPKYFENKKKRVDKARADRNRDRSSRTSESQATDTSFAQRTPFICHCCGKEGHGSNTCSKRNTIPRDQWYINQAIQHMQDAQSEEDTNDTDSLLTEDTSVTTTTSTSGRNRRSGNNNNNNNERQQTGWNHLQRAARREFQGFQGIATDTEHVHNQSEQQLFTNLKNVILMDSGSTLKSTIANPDFLTNIRVSQNPINMATNIGSKAITLEGDMPGLGVTPFDETHMTNILGLSKNAKEHRITYDSAKEDAFLMHTDNGIIKFEATPEGLYAYQPSAQFLKEVANTKKMKPPKQELSNMVTTVAENRKNYTQRQYERAKEARKLYHIVNAPSIQKFKHILRQNLIQNCPVTSEDVNIAEKIFGEDIGKLKGKSTRRRPVPVREDWVEIPPEIVETHKNIQYCMDVMYVNGMPMLTGIDKTIRYRSLVPLNSRTAEALYEGLDKILRLYNDAGFTIQSIDCDPEFESMMDTVKDELQVEMNYGPAQAHVPEAERNNRTIGEAIRTAYHRLPYRAIPRVMLRNLAMEVTKNLNVLPAKGGVSEYYSPHMILKRENFDYNKHCVAACGQYVQANQENDPTNTNAARTIDGIYLRPMKNKQGGHVIMNIQTGKEMTRQTVKPIPVTETVIAAVEQMAAEQGITTLKIVGRNRVAILPADWTAGVDYEVEDNENYDENDDEDYDENENDEYDDDEESYDDDLVDEDQFDRIDQGEVNEILAESGRVYGDSSPIDDANDEQPQETNDDDSEQQEPVYARPQRQRTQPNRLTYSQWQRDDQWYQENRSVKWEDESMKQLEEMYNIGGDSTPDPLDNIDYDEANARILAFLMCDLKNKVMQQGASFAQQYILQKGLKKFGYERGSKATMKELDQLHRRTCYTPIDVSKMTPEEKRKAVEALMLLTEKRDGSIKGRLVYNGKKTRTWVRKEDAASPTASLEAHFLCAIIDAKEGRDVMSADVPNAFIQAFLPDIKDGEERVIMKITGVLVDLLVEMEPETYGPYVVYENGQKVLYVQVLKALYGMLVAALLWYKKFRSDLENIGFEFNPYDPCVANREVERKQQTVRFHVDDLMSSHAKSKVNDEFLKWLNEMYGEYGEVKATRGDIHDYLGMTFDFSEKGKVKVDMIDYMNAMVDEFPMEIKPDEIAPNPAAEDLFKEGTGAKLKTEHADTFHTIIAKGLFACKRARPDIHTAISVLCTRTKKPNLNDWKKMMRLLRYINGTRNDKLILSADDLHVLKHYIDTSFAVHEDFKSHSGAGTTLGRGFPITGSRKQKLNTRSSTEAELVGDDDFATMILWTKLFMEAQGYEIKENILYQDNKSTILLAKNGKRSSSKRTRAINIRYFFLTDQIEKGNLTVEYCPTEGMVADYMTKPLQGKLWLAHKKRLMGWD